MKGEKQNKMQNHKRATSKENPTTTDYQYKFVLVLTLSLFPNDTSSTLLLNDVLVIMLRLLHQGILPQSAPMKFKAPNLGDWDFYRSRFTTPQNFLTVPSTGSTSVFLFVGHRCGSVAELQISTDSTAIWSKVALIADHHGRAWPCFKTAEPSDWKTLKQIRAAARLAIEGNPLSTILKTIQEKILDYFSNCQDL